MSVSVPQPVFGDAPQPTAKAVSNVLEVRNLRKSFTKIDVLHDVTFSLPKGEVLVIMGGSGSGKSTLLNCLIGALRPDGGQVILNQRNICSLSTNELAEARRGFGMMFQHAALFNSMTVGENVALPLLESGISEDIAELVVKLKLELVGLTGFEHLMPSELSGGMKKRVGLARALALDPTLLFCDEPTAGLDPVMTAVIDQLILDLVDKINLSAVVVTHDMVSAFRIATRMVFLFEGRILIDGTPDEVAESDNEYLQQFIRGQCDGPIPYKLSKDDYMNRLMGKI